MFESVAVIGAGTMGNGIAQTFARYGARVLLVDLSEDALKKGLGAIEDSLARVVKKGGITDADAKTTLASVPRRRSSRRTRARSRSPRSPRTRSARTA
jgi:3-hydroxybutyryl-CoA dehydrogenase